MNRFRNRVQLLHPILKRWVKVSTETGRIIAVKRGVLPWSGIKVFVSSSGRLAFERGPHVADDIQ